MDSGFHPYIFNILDPVYKHEFIWKVLCAQYPNLANIKLTLCAQLTNLGL